MPYQFDVWPLKFLYNYRNEVGDEFVWIELETLQQVQIKLKPSL
jgi:hypothetical protein